MKLVKYIASSKIGKAAIAGATLLAVGCASNGDVRKEAYNEWTKNTPQASEKYNVEKNYFASSLGAKLQTSSNITGNGMNLQLDLGQTKVNYPIGGDLSIAIKDNGAEYEADEVINAVQGIRFSEKQAKYIFQGYLDSSNLNNIKENMLGDLENLVDKYSSDKKISAEYKGFLEEVESLKEKYSGPLNLGNIKGIAEDLNHLKEGHLDTVVSKYEDISEEVNNLTEKYSRLFGSALDSLTEDIKGFPNDYKFSSIPSDDLIKIGSDLYNFVAPENKITASAETNFNTYSKQSFQSNQNPDKAVVVEQGVIVKGGADFSLKTSLETQAEEGLTVGEATGAKVPQQEDFKITLPRRIPTSGYPKKLEEILDTKLPKLSGKAETSYDFKYGYKVEEGVKIDFPINNNKLQVGFSNNFSHSMHSQINFRADANTNIKDTNIVYTQTDKELVTNKKSSKIYAALKHDSQNSFGYAALGLKEGLTYKKLRQSSSMNSMTLTNIVNPSFQSSEQRTENISITEDREILGDVLLGTNFDMGILGTFSPYRTLNLSGESKSGLLAETNFVDALISKDRVSAIVPIVPITNDARFSKLYKEQLLANPSFVTENPDETREIRNRHFLNNSGLFFTFDKESISDLKFGLLHSKKGKFFSHLGFTPGNIPKYSFNTGSENFALGLNYARGVDEKQALEEYGASASFNTGRWNWHLDLTSGSTDLTQPFHEQNLRFFLGVSTNR